MKKKLTFLILSVCSFVACGEKNQYQKEFFTNEKPASSQQILLASKKSNKTINSTSCSKEAYQTKTGCFLVKVNCSEGELNCQDVDLKFTNKNTGQEKKYKGKTWINVVNMNFNGYIFKVGKDRQYYIDLRNDNISLTNADGSKTFSEEEITHHPNI